MRLSSEVLPLSRSLPLPSSLLLVDVEAERQARRRAAADRADQLLKHINTHFKKYEFSGGWPEQRREADRLRLADTATAH